MFIKNERQYMIARTNLAEAEAALPRIRGEAADLPRGAAEAYISAYVGNMKALRERIDEYEATREGETSIDIRGFSDVPEALIKLRIRRGWTQRQLAAQLEVAEQQVQRWEEHEYQNVQFRTIERVARALGLEVYSPAREVYSPA